MKQLFNKVACFTDLHLGNKHNSRVHNNDCSEFIEWFIAEAKNRGCNTCICLGDFHHHRSNVNVSTLNYSNSVMTRLNESFDHTYIIAGNHDLFYREKREISSLINGINFSNITVVDEKIVDGDVAIVPWLVEDEWKEVKKIKTKYMFGHFEIPGFKMNALVEMPDHGQINRTHFQHQDYVFSGHFHKRQQSGNVHYIGNPFGHNYADAWDFERGAMFLNWGEEPEYVDWEDGPRYITCKLSKLLDNTEEYLKPKTYAKVTLDIDITYEEANFLRETFMENYDIREFKLLHESKESEEHEFEGEIEHQTVDQIVLEQLGSIESNSFENNKLLSIYNEL